MKLAREIAEVVQAVLLEAVNDKLVPQKHGLIGGTSESIAVLESLVAAKLEEFHRTTKVRLQSVEYALDPSPKWADTEHPPMTQAEALSMVRCVLATLSEEAS